MDLNRLKEKLNNYCKLLEEKQTKEWACVYNHYKYTYTIGKKYIRVVQCDYKGNPQSSFCFVDFEGNLYKCAGWKKPAPGIRGHLDHPILDGYGFYRRGA